MLFLHQKYKKNNNFYIIFIILNYNGIVSYFFLSKESRKGTKV